MCRGIMNKELPSSVLCAALAIAVATPELLIPTQVVEVGCATNALCAVLEHRPLHELPWSAEHAPPVGWNSAPMEVSGTTTITLDAPAPGEVLASVSTG
jgi:hypothetical protein